VEHNSSRLSSLCGGAGIDIQGVTKVTCGDPEVARAILSGGARTLGESRIDNIRRLKEAGIEHPIALIRSPAPDEVGEVVEWSDICLISERLTITEMGKKAREVGSEQEIVLMVDLGDRREGALPGSVPGLAKLIADTEGLVLRGIGTNLACFGGVIPTVEKLEELVTISEGLRSSLGTPIEIVSGGNSANLDLVMKGVHPDGINELRLGESIMLGLETVRRRPIPGLHLDAFRISGALIELRRKPSKPDGEIGQDAFGGVPEIEDRGEILHGLVDIGRQDCDPAGMRPAGGKVDILGSSSDHLIVEVSGSGMSLGDEVSFIPTYGALLRAMTSPYVEKIYRY